ncbi:MAG: DUF983 domain-containing protein [Flavobacteriia bacterium]|nr:DUF983 domain-containing protein [Flavobacteriia bacterium]
MKKLISILFLKCPRCRKGKLLQGHPYQLKHFNKVNASCSHCRLHYKIEPSFFYGSMYVSYGLGVGLSIAVFLLLYLLGLTKNVLPPFLIITGILILLMPYINALSKVIWANLFFTYRVESNKS